MTLDVGADDDVDVWFTDSGEAVTYQHGGAHSVAAATLTETTSFTDVALTAVRTEVTKRELESGAGFVDGDVHWHVRIADLSAVPAADDRIVAGAETWYVRSWTRDPLGITYDILARM